MTLTRIQHWYLSQCDGDWEHGQGIRIETLDNPGWKLEVNLEGTELASRPFKDIHIERTETDWLHAKRDGQKFQAFGGPTNLEECLQVFCNWADLAT